MAKFIGVAMLFVVGCASSPAVETSCSSCADLKREDTSVRSPSPPDAGHAGDDLPGQSVTADLGPSAIDADGAGGEDLKSTSPGDLAAPVTNTIPITVGTASGNQNTPYVTVTVCAPGTTTCQTIPNIELATGSTGLRIFASVLTITLPQEKHSTSGVAECVQFGGGDVLWGPVRMADVGLGDEKAGNVPIHVADSTFLKVPAACGSTADTQADFGSNGILGISPASTDCDGETCPGTTPGKFYYTCTSKTCTALSPAVTEQVQNPAQLLPVDNNGIVVAFPALAGAAVVAETGALIFGIGTQSNNQPAAAGARLRHRRRRNSQRQFHRPTILDEIRHRNGLLDTARQSGNQSLRQRRAGLLCPTSPVALSFTVVATNGDTSPSVSFEVGDATTLSSSNLAFENVAWNNVIDGAFLLPLSFFFGRSVYVGFNGQTSTLGAGPYYGF